MRQLSYVKKNDILLLYVTAKNARSKRVPNCQDFLHDSDVGIFHHN
jgi:hypothetical protein